MKVNMGFARGDKNRLPVRQLQAALKAEKVRDARLEKENARLKAEQDTYNFRIEAENGIKDQWITKMQEEIAAKDAEIARLQDEKTQMEEWLNSSNGEMERLKRTNSTLNAKLLGIKTRSGEAGTEDEPAAGEAPAAEDKPATGSRKRQRSDAGGFGTEKKPKSPPTTRKRGKPDERVEVDQDGCPECGKPLSKARGKYGRTAENIVDGWMRVIEYVVKRRYCRYCKTRLHVEIDGVLFKERFGTGVIAKGGALKQMGITFGQCKEIFELFTGAKMARSTFVHFYGRSAEAPRSTCDQLQIELVNSRNVHGDETRWYINGKLVWLWIFKGEGVTIFEIDKSRGRKVPLAVLGKDYPGCVTSDSNGAWNYVGRVHQKCLVHYMRELTDTLKYKNPGPEFIPFARTLRRILHEAAEPEKGQREGDSTKTRKRKVKKLKARVRRLISMEYKEENCIRFVKKPRREFDHLFTLILLGTKYHNNPAEEAIRPSTVIRKISYGSKTPKGADNYKIMATVMATCKMHDVDFYGYLKAALEGRANTGLLTAAL